MLHVSGSPSGFAHLPPRTQSTGLLLLAADRRADLLAALRIVRSRVAADQPVPPPARGTLRHRLAILGTDAADLLAKIDVAERHVSDAAPIPQAARQAVYYTDQPAALDGESGKTAFLFPGQGSQHAGMLGELCLRFPQLREWLEDLDAAVADLPVPAPSLLAYQPSDIPDEQRAFLTRELYELRGGAQILLAANLGVLDLMSDLRVPCDAMLGHSNGEHAALFGSGTFRPNRAGLFRAMRRMAERALALEPSTSQERVITVAARDRAMVEHVVASEAGVYLAMINCPSQLVVAGLRDPVERVARAISTSGGMVVPVPLDRAFHTPLFAEWGRWLRGLYDDYDVGPGHIPLYSSMTADLYPSEPARIRDLAAAQWSNPVDFDRSVRRLYEDGVRTFIEVGPGNKLSGFVGDILRGRDYVTLSTSGPRDSSLQPLQRLVARLFVDGRPLDLESATARILLHPLESGAAEEPSHHAQVIESHFALMREFLDQQARVFERVASASRLEDASLPGDGVASDGRQTEIVRRFDLEHDPLLRDHSLGARVARGTQPAVQGLAVIPFTFTLDVVAQAALELYGRQGVVTRISSARGSRWLALDRGQLTVRITAEADPHDAGVTRVKVFDEGASRDPLAFEADVRVRDAWPAGAQEGPAIGSGLAETPTDLLSSRPSSDPPRRWSVTDFYRDFAFHGPAFQGIHSVVGVGSDDIEAELRAVPPPGGHTSAPPRRVDPALLDCSGQLVGFWLLEQGLADFGIFPYQLQEIRIHQPAPAAGSRFRGRARIRWQVNRATDADVDVIDDAGRPIYLLRGFAQRYMPLPRPIVRALFVKSPEGPFDAFVSSPLDGVPGARVIDISGELPRAFLDQSWGIWGRALAHQSLSAPELDRWYDRQDRSTSWLLTRIAAKEAVIEWMTRIAGVEAPTSALTLDEDASGHLRVSGPTLAALPATPLVQVNSDGDRVIARINRQPAG